MTELERLVFAEVFAQAYGDPPPGRYGMLDSEREIDQRPTPAEVACENAIRRATRAVSLLRSAGADPDRFLDAVGRELAGELTR